MIARVAALIMAILSVAGIALNWPDGTPITAEQVAEALTLGMMFVTALLGAWRTWRSKSIESRPAGEVIPEGSAEANLRAEHRRRL
jgi:uncharacterized membrane protein YphA (DoxX/SURF4 family)